jgi:hypothetical protein
MPLIAGILGIAIMILILAVVVTIGPVIGGKVEQALPTDLGASSMWNSTYNTNLPAGASIWEDNIAMLSVAATIVIVSIIIAALKMGLI